MNHILFFALLCMNISTSTMSTAKPIVYLIPGQGADARLFNNLRIHPGFEVRPIKYFTPEKGTSLPEYARQLAAQIDTTRTFSLVGVSLGGMLATEMTDFLQPEQTIIISSAKTRHELPGQYRFQRRLPLYKLVGPRLAKWGALLLQPIVEPDRNQEKETFVQMLRDKDPHFLRRTIEMILRWERTTAPVGIYHLHGDRDRTIPIRNVAYTHHLPDGSHMMTLTRGAEVSKVVNDLLMRRALP